jgi:hypothetical protein
MRGTSASPWPMPSAMYPSAAKVHLSAPVPKGTYREHWGSPSITVQHLCGRKDFEDEALLGQFQHLVMAREDANSQESKSGGLISFLTSQSVA